VSLRPMTPEVVRAVEFDMRFRGYDTDEVDAFLEEVALALEELAGHSAGSGCTGGASLSEPLPDSTSATRDEEGAGAPTQTPWLVRAAEFEAERILRDADRRSRAMTADALAAAQHALAQLGQLRAQLQGGSDGKEPSLGEVRTPQSSSAAAVGSQ